ncbi:hypothetical protein Tco_1516198 [Tanacetum coccineum]
MKYYSELSNSLQVEETFGLEICGDVQGLTARGQNSKSPFLIIGGRRCCANGKQYGVVVYAKPSRDFTRPLGPPSGLKGLLHTLNATVIPTKLFRMMKKLPMMVEVARRSRLEAWLKACCLFIIPSKSRGVIRFISSPVLF